MDFNIHTLQTPNPGPIDGSILSQQFRHRSEAVWEAKGARPEDSRNIRVRRVESKIRKRNVPSPAVLELIRRARLEGLCSVPFVSLDWGLITALVERWRPETHTFHMRPGESTITLQDVEVLLGIPVDGLPITGNTQLDVDGVCTRLLGEAPATKDKKGKKISMQWLRNRFKGIVDDGADAEVLAQQARGYLLLLLGGTIFADFTGSFVHCAYLLLLENFDQAGEYSWGSGALAVLYHNLCHGAKKSSKQMTGPFILVQVWAWERFPLLAPTRIGRRAPLPSAPVEVVDDNSIEIMFDVADKISGYTPTLFTETTDANFSQPHENDIQQHSSQRSQRQSWRYQEQNRQDDSAFFQNDEQHQQEDSPFFQNENQHQQDGSIYFQNEENIDNDEATHSSEEDVDANLEADEIEEEPLGMFEQPPTMMTRDTWTNLIDPSPPMPSNSHIGWDGRSELFEGQKFFSKLEVKNTVKKYSMDRNYVATAEQSTRSLLVYKCANPEPCSWRVRAIRKVDEDMWTITRYSGPHTCMAFSVTSDHQMLDARYMSNMIMSTLAEDASIKVKAFQAMIKDKCEGYYPSYAKTWAAKQMAIAEIYGDWEDSFAELPRYLEAIKQSNPGTQTHIRTKEMGMPGHVIFDAVFWAFGPSIEGFKHCRPVISVDGTFLTGRYKGVMLIATSQDAENQMFPIAFAIVEKENKENWGWFLNCIRFYVTQREGLCLISDRHAGLLSYLQESPEWRPPSAYHRYCVRHLGANYTRRYNKTVGDQVKLVACEIQVQKFEVELQKLQRFSNGEVNKDLEKLNLRRWSCAHDGGRRYGARTTNLSESFNGVLKEARHLPIVATIRMTFYKCVEYFNDHAVKARDEIDSGQMFSKFARKKFEAWRDKARRHSVIEFVRIAGLYEVVTPTNPTSPYKGNHRHTVDFNSETCTCNKMQQWRIPCSHVIAVCNKMAIDPRQFIADVWKLESIIAMHCSRTFVPVRDKMHWPPYEGPIIHPDQERLRGRGRPKVNRFRNEMDWLESQPSQKQSCGLCGGQGHNRRKCSIKRGEGSSSAANM